MTSTLPIAPSKANDDTACLPNTVAELDKAVHAAMTPHMASLEDPEDSDEFEFEEICELRSDFFDVLSRRIRQNMLSNVDIAWNESIESVDGAFTCFPKFLNEIRLKIVCQPFSIVPLRSQSRILSQRIPLSYAALNSMISSGNMHCPPHESSN